MKHPFILFILAALSAILCAKQWGWTIASASAEDLRSNKGGNNNSSIANGSGLLQLQLSDFFSSFIGDGSSKNSNARNNNIQLSHEKLSSFLQNLQQSLTLKSKTTATLEESSDSTKRRGNDNVNWENPHRRKVLFELSVRAHYATLLRDHEYGNVSAVSSMDVAIDSCEYYNDGMQSSFDIRDENLRDSSKEEESTVLARFSHWTYRFCPKKSLSQIHLEPMAITDNLDTAAKEQYSNKDSEILKLPPNSVLSDTIQFLISDIHDLGSYLSPLSPDYESYITAAWGVDEIQPPIRENSIEYYIGGDACNGSMERHSKVIYDTKCCNRKHDMMEEFFHNHGQVIIRSAEEPRPCRYVLRACTTCTLETESATETLDSSTESTHANDPPGFLRLLQSLLQGNSVSDDAFPPMPPSMIEENKNLLRSMFMHAYDSYFYNAFPASELKPLTCEPGVFDLVRVPALTLIDTLDTFIILGNYTEFARSVERLRYLDDKMKRRSQFRLSLGWAPNGLREGEVGGLFSVNQNVSVFETTIRILGGLLSAHQMALAFMDNRVPKSDVWDSYGNILNSTTSGMVDQDDNHLWESRDCPLSPTQNNLWEYDGFLLELAHDVGKRLVYAFDTETGIPYGTVNLLYGVPRGETSVASLAGAGSLSLEFELLSRLTGDSSFGEAAKAATRALWARRSPQLNLLGKHIDVHSGEWTEIVSGVGSNSDSFYEYLIKHYLLFPEDSDFWNMFSAAYEGVQEHSRVGDWYVDVGMGQGLNGHVRQVFESLMAFFPGLQVLLGEMVPAATTVNAFFSVREFLGLLPERFDFIRWKTEDSGNVHPLRPELLESCYFLHLASMGLHGSKRGPCCHTNSSHLTSNWLWAADFALRAVNQLAWTPCGFATVTNVGPTTTGKIDVAADPKSYQRRIKALHRNEMPSYFLSETIKYLYLTFDADNNILHKDNEREWIFTTEAHPIHYVDSVNFDDNRINTQLDQVRTLLKEIVDDEFGIVTTVPLNESTISYVEESIGFIESRPPNRKASVSTADAASFGIFSSEISAINEATAQFDSRGKGSEKRLSKRCPNFHHPDLQWRHALNGESMDYTFVYQPLLMHSFPNSNDDLDQRMLTALSSACFFGTDYYASGIEVDSDASCHVMSIQNDMKNAKIQRLDKDIIPGASRYYMGGDLGAFDARIFPGGDGFVVRNVESSVLLEVSLFYSHPQIDGRLAMVILTAPPTRQEYSSFRKRYLRDKIELSLWSLNGSWGRLSSSSGVLKESFEDDAEPNLMNDHHRHVVVADMSSNSFICSVVITKRELKQFKLEGRDLFISNFPCSPAMFGKASVSNLVQEDGVVVEGLLIPPPAGDNVGCKSMIDPGIRQLDNNFVQLINRGDCSFMHKSDNYRNARGIIVINSDPNELFVMSGEIPQSGERSSAELPVSVLVSGNDGALMIKLLHDEQSIGNVLKAQIQLTRNEVLNFPRVEGKKEALHISVSDDWGVQAVSRGKSGQNELQLFITQPTVAVDAG